MPRYFIDLPEESAPSRWEPCAGPRHERADLPYFGAVFCAMEPLLRDGDIDVYYTWDLERLPAYGERVVAVVAGDEVGRVPRYIDRVRAVFRCHGTRPQLGNGPLRNPSLAGFLELAQWSVRWLRWLPGGARYGRAALERRRRGLRAPAFFAIPVGTLNQIDLPVVPIEERQTDVFFAGSVIHGGSVRQRLASPKPSARREMLTAVRRLERLRPDLRMELRVTPGFEASTAASPAAYSQALMDARVCLAPRGTGVETCRVFEGLRAGCVVVSERLPRHWFYDGAPVIQLDRWNGLAAALLPVLDDPGELRRRHERALDWWRERCSENAVGRFLAEQLNALDGAGLAEGPCRAS